MASSSLKVVLLQHIVSQQTMPFLLDIHVGGMVDVLHIQIHQCNTSLQVYSTTICFIENTSSVQTSVVFFNFLLPKENV
jgi:preprotein translocase subunit SecB